MAREIILEVVVMATTKTGFEKLIWDAACILRGNMDVAEYKYVNLGLVFLKYISGRFELWMWQGLT